MELIRRLNSNMKPVELVASLSPKEVLPYLVCPCSKEQRVARTSMVKTKPE